MLEEELYEPMRMWLEQYMIDNYKGYEIITTDCHSERLDRVLAKYDIVKEQANGVDIQIDVLGIARKQGKVKLVIFMQQANELGLDMPDKIMMQIEYPNTFVGNLKNGIQILKKKKDQGYFSDIILIGEDDFGIEQSFDFTSIIKNIEVAVKKNEDDRYDENEVERNFFEKIR